MTPNQQLERTAYSQLRLHLAPYGRGKLVLNVRQPLNMVLGGRNGSRTRSSVVLGYEKATD